MKTSLLHTIILTLAFMMNCRAFYTIENPPKSCPVTGINILSALEGQDIEKE